MIEYPCDVGRRAGALLSHEPPRGPAAGWRPGPRRRAAAALLVALAGCGGDEDEGLDTCVGALVTIEQGVYGQLILGCDTDECNNEYGSGIEIRAYDADPTPAGRPPGGADKIIDFGTTLTPVALARSGKRGFFELSLPPATYYLCPEFGVCTKVLLSAARPLERQDWSSGPGGGYWYGYDLCPEEGPP